MSLRWHLCGARLSERWPTLGSGDGRLLHLLRVDLEKRVREAVEEGGFDTPSDAAPYQSDVQQILDRAVREGIPFPDLRAEEEVHVQAADVLARAGQQVYETDSWDWKQGAWYDLHEQLGEKLAGKDKQLLDWLVLGRPLFGREFDTAWEFYSYLSRREAVSLRAMLAAALERGDCPRPAGDRHFTKELIGWLDDITGREMDVWVRAE